MKRQTILLLTGLVLFLCSCGSKESNKAVHEGKVSGNVYTSEEVGWQIEIPDGWEIMQRDKIEAMNENGRETMEEMYDATIDVSGMKHLIHFQKDQFNLFQSTIETFPIENESDWVDNNNLVKSLIYETYVGQGIRADSSSYVAYIDSLRFDVFKLVIYGPDGAVILNQELYGRHINGYSMAVNLNYNNSTDQATMMEVWERSTFR